MSWSAFDEFKTFASKIKDQCKRKKDWNRPPSNKRKSLDRSSVEEESGIDRFSSDEEHEERFAQRPTHSGKHKLESPSKRRSPRSRNPRKRIRTDNELGNLIDDSEGTPEDDLASIKPNNIGTAVSSTSKYNASASDEANLLMETLDVMIKDFNSSDEEEKQEDEEPNIETPTPTPTPSSNSTPPPSVKQSRTTETSITGSEWLKRVQSIASKSTEEASDIVKTDVDSAKKTKQKFKRSGLAEQLQKVINREKSEKTFWTHKQTTGSQDTGSTLDVQILSVQVQYSLCFTRCCVLSSKDGNNKHDVVDVVFNAETSKHIVPRVGSAVRLHPPWQKLHPPSSPYPVLLCTYYCEKLSTPPGSPLIDLASLTDVCMIPNQPGEGSSHLMESPQKGFKPTKLLFESDTVSKLAVPDNSSKDKVCLPSIAKAIETQGGCSGESVSFQAVIQRIYRRRVKIPRDKTIESPGHLALSKSLITRARNGDDKEETRWTFLVQDSTFNLCEVQISEEFAQKDEWISCIKSGEGRLYNFVDLMVSQRTNRTRSPGLFSVVDSLWCAESTNHSQDDKSSQIHFSQDTSSQLSLPLSSAPSHCYMLTVQEDSHVTPCDGKDVTNLSSLYKSPNPVSLQDMCLHHHTPKRFTVWCKVICSRPSSSSRIIAPLSGFQSWTGQLLVTDASLHCGAAQSTQETQTIERISQYLKIDIRPSFVMSEEIKKAVLEAGSVLYFQDIVCSGIERHVIYADSYSTIKKGATDPCQADLDTGDVKVLPLSIYSDLFALRTREFISPLSPASNLESLCKIEARAV